MKKVYEVQEEKEKEEEEEEERSEKLRERNSDGFACGRR